MWRASTRYALLPSARKRGDVQERLCVGMATHISNKAKVVKETWRALLISAPDFDDEPFWVPKACIHDNSDVYEADTEGSLIVETWFAEKQGWV